MSTRTVITNPPPLDPWFNFPYTITPFPLDWLMKFTSLGNQPDPAVPDKNSDSLETWT